MVCSSSFVTLISGYKKIMEDSLECVPLKTEDIVDCFDERFLPFTANLVHQCMYCNAEFTKKKLKNHHTLDLKILSLEVVFKHLCKACGKDVIDSGDYLQLENLAAVSIFFRCKTHLKSFDSSSL